jgi:hypothetical protein
MKANPSSYYAALFPDYEWGKTMLGTGMPNWVRLQKDGYCITHFPAERIKAEVETTKPDYELIKRLRRDKPKYAEEWVNKDWGQGYNLVIQQKDNSFGKWLDNKVIRPHPRFHWGRNIDTTSNPITLVKNAGAVHSWDSTLLIDAMLWGVPAYAYNPNSFFHGSSEPDKWLTWFFTEIATEVV